MVLGDGGNLCMMTPVFFFFQSGSVLLVFFFFLHHHFWNEKKERKQGGGNLASDFNQIVGQILYIQYIMIGFVNPPFIECPGGYY